MKMTKKKVLVVALAVSLIAIASMGTLAWFSAQDEVTNQFQVLDSLTSFNVDVWEKLPDGDDEDDEMDVIGKGDTDENSHVYKDVVPGGVYAKEVYVENTSNNALAGQYIKMELTFVNYSGIHAMTVDLGVNKDEPAFDCTKMLEGANFSTVKDAEEKWWYDTSATRYDEESNTVTYVFYLKDVLDNAEYEYLFTGVKIPETMDINDADVLKKSNGFQIKAGAYAIQSANISKPEGKTTLDNVVYAFETVWGTDGPDFPAYPEISVDVEQ